MSPNYVGRPFIASGAVTSGAIQSGMTSTSYLASGAWVPCCYSCRCQIHVGGPNVTVRGIKNNILYYCWTCVGMSPHSREMPTPEVYLRREAALTEGTPACVVADWMYDNRRDEEGDWLMELHKRRTGG
jgi:hypothetical protein